MKKTILVIRESDEFSRILAADGYEIENLPLIETKPLDDLQDFEKRLDEIEIYDGIFITSRNAARIFDGKLREKEINFSGKIYVLGRRSYEILENLNLDLFFDETANTAREMLEKITSEDLKNKRFLFVRGEISLRVVPDFLAQTAIIDETIVYATSEIFVEADKIESLREKFENGEIEAVCFFSPSAGESFIKQFGAEILHQTFIATIGETTVEFFAQRNVAVDFVSPKASAETFAVELSQKLKSRFVRQT